MNAAPAMGDDSAARRADRSDPDDRAESGVRTIVLVDDDHSIVEALGEILEAAGFRVITAANGRDGLTALERERPDIVLLDVMMPIVDGVEVARRMRAHPELAQTPVLIMSAAPLPRELAGTKAMRYLAKPFEVDELLEAIRELLDDAAGPA